MSWAAKRRFIILLLISAVIVAFFAILSVATFYDVPTCTDGFQNQDESGVDCGGSCALLCAADHQPPTVLFTKALSNGSGRTDVIASIENKNATAAVKNVSYEISLYGKGQVLIQESTGVVDLPPNVTTPLYVPGIVSGKQVVVGAFLAIDASTLRWFIPERDSRIVPLVSNTKQSGTDDAPRIEAILTNPSAMLLRDVRVIVLVRDEQGDVIGASQTVVPIILAQGQSTATFTWNTAFKNAPASIEVVPIIPL